MVKYWDEKNKKLMTAEERAARLAAEKEATEKAATEASADVIDGMEPTSAEEQMMGFEEPAEPKSGRKRK